MFIKRHVNFFPHKENNKYVIRLRVLWNLSKCENSFNVGFRVNPDKWNYKKQRCSSASVHYGVPAADINKKIDIYEGVTNEVFSAFERENRIPTKNEFRIMFKHNFGQDITPKAPKIEIIQRIYEYLRISKQQKQWADNTYKAVQNGLKRFVLFLEQHQVVIITTETLYEFVNYLVENNIKNTTIKTIIIQVKTFCMWLHKNYHTPDILTNFNPKIKTIKNKDVVFLTPEELQAFATVEIPPYLELNRRAFLFACYTGLRYSDIIKLRWVNIYDGAVHITTTKTSTGIVIELNKYAADILENTEHISDLVFPFLPSGSSATEHIKEIAKLAHIDSPLVVPYFVGSTRKEKNFLKWEVLGTHTARRTFVVLALSSGVPAEIIIRWTGHQNFDALKPYFAVLDSVKSSAMNRFSTHYDLTNTIKNTTE